MFIKNSRFWPHNWLGLTSLRRLFLVLFYVTAAVGVYAAVCWAQTWFLSAAELAANSAPLRRLYSAAALQAALAALAWMLLARGLKALDQIQHAANDFCKK